MDGSPGAHTCYERTMATAPERPALAPGYVLFAMVGWLTFVIYWSFAARDWFFQLRYREVTAKVEEVRVERGVLERITKQCSNRSDRTPHSVLTTYSYEVNGRRYTAEAWNRQYASEIFCSEETAQARVAELRTKGTLTAWYDPNDPRVAVQQKEEASEIFFVYGALFALGAGLVVLFLRQRRVHRAYRAAFDAWTSS